MYGYNRFLLLILIEKLNESGYKHFIYIKIIIVWIITDVCNNSALSTGQGNVQWKGMKVTKRRNGYTLTAAVCCNC